MTFSLLESWVKFQFGMRDGNACDTILLFAIMQNILQGSQ